jgi:hypothetical protein
VLATVIEILCTPAIDHLTGLPGTLWCTLDEAPRYCVFLIDRTPGDPLNVGQKSEGAMSETTRAMSLSRPDRPLL